MEFFTTENVVALFTLAGLEIVLGIDNIVMLSILTADLPETKQKLARRLGLGLAMIMRIALLCSLSWLMGLTKPFFTVLSQDISGRDLILLVGGVFLVAKATFEIHERLEAAGQEGVSGKNKKYALLVSALIQIVLFDMLFSLDSIITAVGMAQILAVMIGAVIIAVAVMMIFANAVCEFVENHPTVKMLALSFLIMIGVMLVMEGMGKEIEKGYIYTAMFFSMFVEYLNMKYRKLAKLRASARRVRDIKRR